MIAVTFQRVEFLRKIHLFHDLKDEELTALAEKLEEKVFAPGKVIMRQGDEGDRFYLVFSGRVKVSRVEGRKQKDLAVLVEGDFFGEEALMSHHRRSATVTAEYETVLLTLTHEGFQQMVKQVPDLRAKLAVSIASRRLARRRAFPWLEEGEVVYYITRKHEVVLWRALAGPALALLLPLVLVIIYALTISAALLYVAGLLFVAIVLWIAWRAIDWGNDYYIVTNRRVVWVEKVVGLYDSRQESPLTAILSVNSETDMTGRMLGYGDVIVRTFVGKIVFHNVGRPDQVVALVRQYWERTKDVSRRSNIDALKNAIRTKLGLSTAQPPVQPLKPAIKPLYKPGLLQILGANLFKVRFEESGTIIYRKHWFVLFEQTVLPGTLFIGCLAWLLWRVFSGPLSWGTFDTVLLIFALISFLWWLYQYVDWSNDVFQVTEDQILDIDRTPLGRVQKNVAPLDNILNLESRREGFLQVLFNYGNVYITVGGAQLVFENVMDPPAVQQDIDRRRVARREKQDQDRAAVERDRLAEFFAMYHTNADEFRHEQEARGQNPVQPSPDPNPDPENRLPK